MEKATTTVGVLMGGLSSEREISRKSGRAVTAALERRGWRAVPIDVGRDLPERLLAEGVDVAWLALHGRFGEDGCVQGLLEVMGIPYTGSGVKASAVAMDKIATKRAVCSLIEVELAADGVLRAGDTLDHVRLPVVVKPAIGGSTVGISVVRSTDALRGALDDAFALNAEVLVEDYVSGDEITVAILDGEALPVIRIAPESGFFDFEAKYTDGRTRYEVPASLPESVLDRARQAATAVYVALGCRGLARADFIVSEDRGPVFLEINTIPGMTETSLCPMAAGRVGISFEDLVERVLRTAQCMSPEIA